MEDDIFSTTNVSLLEEVESPRRLVSSPVPFIKKKNDILEDSSGSQKSDILQSSNSSEQWNVIEAPPETLAKSTNLPMPLKHKENVKEKNKKKKDKTIKTINRNFFFILDCRHFKKGKL